MARFSIYFTLILLLTFPFYTVIAEENDSTKAENITLEIGNWLATETVLIPYGYMDAEVENLVVILFEDPLFDVTDFWPEKGMSFDLAPGKRVTFNEAEGNRLSFSPIPQASENKVFFGCAGTYFNSSHWGDITFNVTGLPSFKLFLDGEEITSRTEVAESDTDKVSATETVDEGFHRLFFITALNGEDSLDSWDFTLSLEWEEEEVEKELTITTNPKHPFDFYDYYFIDGVSDLKLSENGRWLAASISPWDRKNDRRESKLSVWDMKTKKKVWEYVNPKSISNLRWSPDGKKLMIVLSSATSGSDIYLWHRESRLFERIAHEVEDAGSFTWDPGGKIIYYTVTDYYEDPDEKPYKAMWGLEDRWTYFRNNTEIHYMTIDGNSHGKLTAGKYDPNSFIISPDGSTILMLRSIRLTDRPFLGYEFWTISTNSGEANLVKESNLVSVDHICFSPDGKQIAFDGPVNPVEGMDSPFPDNNDNQTDLWTLNLETGELVNHTREFEPAVAGRAYGSGFSKTLFWHKDGRIGFTGLHNKKVKLYFFNPAKPGVFEEHTLPTPASDGGEASLGKGSSMFVFQGQNLQQPGDVYWYDWKKKKGAKLIEVHPIFKNLVSPASRIVDYDYVNSDGITIPGYLYYPHGYDETESYPLIVDFYAGVFGFADGFNWMANVFATRGYFVYVPSPRGAIGWGQEFADHHPNDWGKGTTRDMNEGVRHIIANVPGVNGEKCATVSGSYGGYMTMYMLSQPKDHPDFYPYATGISDYGISNLASYWGVGWWGYLYSDMATARNFPWNNPQYYIDHSPLYRADNITVPILLVHGDEDNNVPVMESDQMYTALKVLDRDVEFIRFPGEDHGIASKRQKYLLTKRMHVEWFNKHLKDQPGAWDNRMEDEKLK